MPTEAICERTGKRQWTRKEAGRHAAWWRRARFARMSVYKCKHCGRFHIGNERRG